MPKVVLEFEIKQTGEAVLKQVSGAVEDLGKKAEAAGKPISKVSESVADVKKASGGAAPAVDGFTGILRGLGQQGAAVFGHLAPLIVSLGGLGLGLGATALAAKASIAEFTQFTSRVRDLSFMSGGSAKDVSILVAGLEDLGVESETVQIAMARMSRAVNEGDPALVKLGISTRDAAGHQKNALTLFYETIDTLGSMRDEVARNAISQEIFSRGWTSMIQVLQRGSVEIRRLGEESNKLITAGDIKRMQEYQLAMRDLLNIWETIKLDFGREIVAPITVVVRWALQKPAGGQESATLQGPLGQEFVAAFAKHGRALDLGSGLKPGDVGEMGMASAIADAMGRASTAPRGQTLADLKRELVAAQIAQYQAGIGVLGAGVAPPTRDVGAAPRPGLDRIAAQAAATAELARRSRDRELAELAIAEKNGEVTTAEAAKRRLQIRAKTSAEIANIELEAEQQSRQERIRINQLEVKDRERLLDEYAILGSQAGEADLTQTEFYLGEKFRLDQENAKLLRELREAGFAFDDTINQMTVEDYRVSEGQIAEARARGAREQRERSLRDFREQERLRQETLQGDKDLLLARLQSSDSYFTKISLGFQFQAASARDANALILQGTAGVYQAMERTVSDVFFDVVTGKWQELSKLPEQFGGAMLRELANVLAAKTVREFTDLLGGWSGLLGSAATSIVDWLGAFQAGLWEVPGGPGGQAAIVHPGEMILPAEIAAAVRASLGGGAGGPAGRGPQSVGEAIAAAIGGRLSGTNALAFGLAHAVNSMVSSLAVMNNPLQGILSAVLGDLIGASPAARAVSINARGIAAAFGVPAEVAARIAADLRALSGIPATQAMFESFIAESVSVSQQAAAATAAALGAQRAGERADFGGFQDSPGSGAAGQGPGGGGIGPGGDPGDFYARGGLFNTRGPTRMVVGEAGTETVAIVRNPRAGDVGGGGMTINVNLSLRVDGGVYGDGGIRDLAKKLANPITEEIGRIARRTYTSSGHLFRTRD